jgi:hypothetical protein
MAYMNTTMARFGNIYSSDFPKVFRFTNNIGFADEIVANNFLSYLV